MKLQQWPVVLLADSKIEFGWNVPTILALLSIATTLLKWRTDFKESVRREMEIRGDLKLATDRIAFLEKENEQMHKFFDTAAFRFQELTLLQEVVKASVRRLDKLEDLVGARFERLDLNITNRFNELSQKITNVEIQLSNKANRKDG